MKEIDDKLYDRLNKIGLIPNEARSYNIGASDYSEHLVQPWSIWIDYSLNPFDADIIKRVLRIKTGEERRTEYEKIIHICEERIRQIDAVNDTLSGNDNTQEYMACADLMANLCDLMEKMAMIDGDSGSSSVEYPKYEGGINKYKYIITK